MSSPLHPQEHSPGASLGLRDPCPSPISPPVPPATSPGKRPMQVPCLPQALPGSPLIHSWALISGVPPAKGSRSSLYPSAAHHSLPELSPHLAALSFCLSVSTEWSRARAIGSDPLGFAPSRWGQRDLGKTPP